MRGSLNTAGRVRLRLCSHPRLFLRFTSFPCIFLFATVVRRLRRQLLSLNMPFYARVSCVLVRSWPIPGPTFLFFTQGALPDNFLERG